MFMHAAMLHMTVLMHASDGNELPCMSACMAASNMNYVTDQ